MIPLAALGRLNHHARSVHGLHGNGQRDAIYAYKTLASMVMALDGSAKVRLVQWHGECGRCTDGRFHYWDWEDGCTVACRYCGGSGKVTLRFVEMTLPDGQVWHHPWVNRSTPGLDIARAVMNLSMDDYGRYWTADGKAVEWEDQGLAWYDLVWLAEVRFGVAGFGPVRSGMVGCAMVRF